MQLTTTRSHLLRAFAALAAVTLAVTALHVSGQPAAAAPPDQKDASTAWVACSRAAAQRRPGACPAIGSAPWEQQPAPQPPLPTRSLEPGLGYLLETYLAVTRDQVDIYASPEAAASDGNAVAQQPGGFVYLASASATSVGEHDIYRTPRGSVLGDAVRRAYPSEHRGLAFYRTPQRPFGWINAGGVCTYTAPDPQAPLADRCFTRYMQVEILSLESTARGMWIEVLPGRWISDEFVARVDPGLDKPSSIESDRWIEVNLAEQTLTAYEDNKLVFATVVASGRNGYWTQPGTFQVWAKLERDNMSGGRAGQDGYYFLENVPWVLYFDQARALHGTYWHNRFGSPQSRGCVNLSPTDAEWIYQFAQEGTWVHVYDPSGETPTDPDLYGAGGA